MERPLKLTFLADTHYYSKSLGVSGRQYELRSGSDQNAWRKQKKSSQPPLRRLAIPTRTP